jgi:hypothetical protein
VQRLLRCQPDQPLGVAWLPGRRSIRQRVLDGLAPKPASLVPTCRPGVELVLFILAEIDAQKLGKEGMVAVPLAPMIERDQEEVCSPCRAVSNGEWPQDEFDSRPAWGYTVGR